MKSLPLLFGTIVLLVLSVGTYCAEGTKAARPYSAAGVVLGYMFVAVKGKEQEKDA